MCYQLYTALLCFALQENYTPQENYFYHVIGMTAQQKQTGVLLPPSQCETLYCIKDGFL